MRLATVVKIDPERGRIISSWFTDDGKQIYNSFTISHYADSWKTQSRERYNTTIVPVVTLCKKEKEGLNGEIDSDEYYETGGYDAKNDLAHYSIDDTTGLTRYDKDIKAADVLSNRISVNDNPDDEEKAYLEILKENKEEIEGYDWQYDWYEIIGEYKKKGAHIAAADLNGDFVKELLYMSKADDISAQLSIFTYDENMVKECSYSINNYPGLINGKYGDYMVQGGSDYVIYKGNSGNTLYILDSFGSAKGIICTAIKMEFDPDKKDKIKASAVSYLNGKYYADGKETDSKKGKEFFQAAADDYHNSFDILMFSGKGMIQMGGVFSELVLPEDLANTAEVFVVKPMTFYEAIFDFSGQ